MTTQVGEVALRLRLPPVLADRSDELAGSVGRPLVVAVLEELERRLCRRLGSNAVVRIRSLPVTWRIDAAALDQSDLAGRLAADLADGILAQLDRRGGPERLRPRGDALVAFVDGDHELAAFLADAADGRAGAWRHGGRRDAGAAWSELLERGAGSAQAALEWLERMERLEAVLAAAPDGARTRLAALLAGAGAGVAAGAGDPRPGVRRARAILEHHPGASGARAGVRAEEPGPATASAIGEDIAASDGPPASAGPRVDDAAADADRAAPSAPLPESEDTAAAALAARTRAAGLFYLIGRVLEIDLAECLWAVGVPEGEVLAHVAAALLGDGDDPAWRWFGGAFDRPPRAPEVEAWAAAEVGERVMHGLGRQLARHGMETTPAALDRTLVELADEFPPVTEVGGGLARVVGRAAAALTCMTAARLGRAPDPDLIRTVCHRPGRLELAPDQLTVELAAADLDIEHRRAGLDQDPGQVPWLGRRLAFRFTGLTSL